MTRRDWIKLWAFGQALSLAFALLGAAVLIPLRGAEALPSIVAAFAGWSLGVCFLIALWVWLDD